MSDFIYNDNLNGSGGNKEPINFSFENEKAKSGVSTTVLLVVCILCVAISALLGILGGIFVTRSFTENEKGRVTINEIPRSPYEALMSNEPDSSPSRADVVELIKDTVVEVRTQYTVSNGYLTQSGAGSGVIVGSYSSQLENSIDEEKGYYIITNAHVISDALNKKSSKITVTLTSGVDYVATPVGIDKFGDIAILKIQEDKELPVATLANEKYKLRVGEDIIAIGNPLGQLGGTVTNGYISALDRELEVDGVKMNLLQIDAPINPGNSGGGLFNLRGELVGIVNAKSIGTEIEGLGFAIPINDAAKIYKDLISLGYVADRPTLFIEYDMEYLGGVYVSRVHNRDDGDGKTKDDNSDSIELYDQIYGISVNGKNVAISSADELDKIIYNSEIGSELTLLVRRGNQTGSVTVTVFEYYE